jgi:hypothetical protein
MRKVVISLMALCHFSTALAQPSGYANFTGKFIISGEDAIDPPLKQPKDRVAFLLAGDAAEKIYKALPAAPSNEDVCEEGMKMKRSGGLTCISHGGKSYECSVAILLKSGQTRPFGAC